MKKVLLFLAVILMIISPIFAAQSMSVTWQWMLDDENVNYYRYQIGGTYDDGWTVVAGDVSSCTIDGLDPYSDHILYLQRSYDGENWSETAEAVAYALLVKEEPVIIEPVEELPVVEEVILDENLEVAELAPVDNFVAEEALPISEVVEPVLPEQELAPVEETLSVEPIVEEVSPVEELSPVVEEVLTEEVTPAVEEVPITLEEEIVEEEVPVVEETAPVVEEETVVLEEEVVEEVPVATEEAVIDEAPVETEEVTLVEETEEIELPTVVAETVEESVEEDSSRFAFSLLLKGFMSQPLDFENIDSIAFDPSVGGSLALDFANIVSFGDSVGMGLRLDLIQGTLQPEEMGWMNMFKNPENLIVPSNYSISYDPAAYVTLDARAGIANFNLGLGFRAGMMANGGENYEKEGYDLADSYKLGKYTFCYQLAPSALLGVRFYMGDVFSLGIEATYSAIVGDWLHHNVTGGLVMGFTF